LEPVNLGEGSLVLTCESWAIDVVVGYTRLDPVDPSKFGTELLFGVDARSMF
jgi:hypothetical protein